ncbi:4-hydroxythreonine-4-phosphate dehydrogenase PdxA [Afifella sp. IM 167]|uniref:4-hydroxythreonine-4-phosphate dehydrogenase PdxA n=1 Tax=Afifella sp. IM 167 TaxID=2033586 RepID=UPI001CCEC0CB|nr:4-hydroxythreonine-4-phosphate dehydrogenase PdxA [Afifella sp. IM 167]MBZ8131726.1 4-hydroxythreonine-4-phosphate dehydrogenase PdxA [Afifella sp. IM 167]
MLPIALTLGEAAGVGLDIAIAAWARRERERLPPFVFLGSAANVRERAILLGIDCPVREVTPEEAPLAFSMNFPCLAGFPEAHAEPGEIDPADASTTIASIRDGARLVADHRACALVTNPIAKHVLGAAGFAYPGHTEYLAELGAEYFGEKRRPVMMMAGPGLRTVPVTIHVPVADVPRLLTKELIVETAQITAAELKARFAIPSPRIAISGLNPHAGEKGMIGKEEIEVVAPAIETLRSQGIDATGPLPADTMFHPAARANYDVALCMFHDQALIPVKAIAFDEAVNVTLGLPFIRTSPDHGTAMEIAGTGLARPTSLISAIRLAAEMGRAAGTA